MADRERKRSTIAAELAVLLEAGDNRAAAARARQVLSESERAAEREAARAALARVKPEKAAALAAAAGFVLLALVALLSLLRA